MGDVHTHISLRKNRTEQNSFTLRMPFVTAEKVIVSSSHREGEVVI
jgi:hypothetical protein